MSVGSRREAAGIANSRFVWCGCSKLSRSPVFVITRSEVMKNVHSMVMFV